MGSWGIHSKESDYGLDLLAIVVQEQLKKVDYSEWNVADSLNLLESSIRGSLEHEAKVWELTAKQAKEHLQMNFPDRRESAILLISECVEDFYRKGEITVDDPQAASDSIVEHTITKLVITADDVRKLVDGLRFILSEDSANYCGWEGTESFDEWKSLISNRIQLLEEHMS